MSLRVPLPAAPGLVSTGECGCQKDNGTSRCAAPAIACTCMPRDAAAIAAAAAAAAAAIAPRNVN